MLKMLKLSLLCTALTVASCATKPQPIMLTPGPIICPQSALTQEVAPGEFDPSILTQMSPAAATYVQEREAWWETVLANAEAAKVDMLHACANYNRALNNGPAG